jgi:hypothetical protein
MGFIPFVSNRTLDRFVEPVRWPWSGQVDGVAVTWTQTGSPGESPDKTATTPRSSEGAGP